MEQEKAFRMNIRLFSLIVSAYNEGGNIDGFFEAASTIVRPLAEQGFRLEIVFADDGSSDKTADKIRGLFPAAACNSIDIKLVSFSRNFGKEAAMYAGLKNAAGDFCCFIDADLQQRPETALAMLEMLLLNPDYDCVAACLENRGTGVRQKLSSSFYKILSKSSGMQDVVDEASDFRVFSRAVADALLDMPEYYRFSKGLFAWVGFKTLPFPYTPDERHSGETTWTFPKLVRYGIGGILSFSTAPLQVAIWLGLFTSAAALIYFIVVICQRLFIGIEIPGYATIVALLLMLGGVQLLVLGILGEYLARIYIQGKDRPVFIVKSYSEQLAIQEDE